MSVFRISHWLVHWSIFCNSLCTHMDVKQLSSFPFRLSLTSWGFPCGFYKLKTEIRQGRVAESFVCVTSKSLSYMTWEHNFAGCLLLPFTLCSIQCPSFSKLLLLEQKRTLKYQFNRLTSMSAPLLFPFLASQWEHLPRIIFAFCWVKYSYIDYLFGQICAV